MALGPPGTPNAQGAWEFAVSLLAFMRDMELQPDVACYSAAISACQRGVKPKLAMQLMRDLRKSGLQPDVVAYSAAISACEEGRRWRHALQLLGRLQARDVSLWGEVRC